MLSSFIVHGCFIFIYEIFWCKLNKGKIMTKEKAKIVIYQIVWKRKRMKQWEKLIFKASIRICFKTVKFNT